MAYKYKSDEWYESEPVNVTVGTVAIGSATVYNAVGASYIGLASVNISPIPTGAAWIGLVSTASINGDVNLATLISGEDQTNDVMKVEGQFSTTVLNSATSVLVKGSAGFLHCINVGVMSSPSISIFNAITPTGTPIFTLAPGAPVGTYLFDVNMATGITLNAQGGAAPIIQVSYR